MSGAEIPPSDSLDIQIPNYDDPERRDKGYLAGSIILAVVGCTVVALRLRAQILIARRFAFHDYLIAFALLTSIGLIVAFNLLIYKYGGDLHSIDLPLGLLEDYVLMLWISSHLYIVTQGLIKLSLLVLYLHILRRTSNRVNLYLCWILIGFISAYTIITYFITVFQCNPVSLAYEDPLANIANDDRDCLEQDLITFVPNVIATASDFLVAGFPILFLRQLQLPHRQKWMLVLVFSLGFITCAAGVMRVISLYHWIYEAEDKIWYGYNNQIWTTIETNVGIICACIPILQKQFSAEGVFGKKIMAGWNKLRSRRSSSNATSETDSAPSSSQDDPWQSSTAVTKTIGSKSIVPKPSLTDSQIGVSQTYSVSRSEKTFYDSELV